MAGRKQKGKSSLSGMKPKKRSYTGDIEELKKQVASDASGSDENANAASTKENAEASDRSATADGEEAVEKKRFNFDVPARLHGQFKAAASMRGKTMTEVIQDFMADYVEEAREEML